MNITLQSKLQRKMSKTTQPLSIQLQGIIMIQVLAKSEQWTVCTQNRFRTCIAFIALERNCQVFIEKSSKDHQRKHMDANEPD